jgi:glutamate-1-semialdehyde 2,1-aminomutase
MPKTEINRSRLGALIEAESDRFTIDHPTSRRLFEQARAHLLDGVPMNWMVAWPGPFPIFVKDASGANLTDIDGHRYLDLCLGDTGAMTGHAPPAVVEAISAQAQRGITYMLPTEDAVWLGAELERRFGLPCWQFALTATDANRFAIRLARYLTGRQRIVVFNGCYHGTVDETFISLLDGQPVSSPGNAGPPVDPTLTTRVVEFNDISALESVLGHTDVACVLAEPALTNVGIVLPQPGFHHALREVTRRTGVLLIIDETHTISTGPGGYTQAFDLQPDILTLGKPIAGGVPAAIYGFSAELAARLSSKLAAEADLVHGIGGTLAGNALSLAAMHAAFEHVLIPAFYEQTIPMATRYVNGVESVIREFDLSWHISQLGCRAEYGFCNPPPVNGTQARLAQDPHLSAYMHLASLNRGVLLTPFHNMALISPSVSPADIDHCTEVFREIVQALIF